MNNFKCRFCSVCMGGACIGELPGMGGVNNNENFKLNCAAWKKLPKGPYEPVLPEAARRMIMLAPMTGAVENCGYDDEKQFYYDMVKNCVHGGVRLSLGDGAPDEKLQFGIEAVKAAGEKSCVFCKPYSNEKLFERFEWAASIMNAGGIDIDAYNIVTMRNKVSLEKKDGVALIEIKKFLNKKGVPFILKGIFTEQDVELVKQVKPDAVVISNHGGRVEFPNRKAGSSAEFLAQYYSELQNASGELWVDGGIRAIKDIQTASTYGVKTVLVGRPFVSALCQKKDFAEVIK